GHTYATSGSFPVTVPIHDASQTVTAHSTVNALAACPPGSTVISGNVTGDVVVGRGSSTCLNSATTTGGVFVNRGGSVTILNSTIASRVSSTGASAFRMCNTTVGALVTVHGSTGDVTIGDDTELCGGNAIHGTLALAKNGAGLEVYANTVGGAILLVKNAGASAPAEDATPEVEQNTITGS